MTRYFSKVVDRYFEQWIRSSTWDSLHPADMQRFYQFLKVLIRYWRRGSPPPICESILRTVKDYHPEVDEDRVGEMADFFTSKAETILEYDSVRPPNTILDEMLNPRE